MKMLFEPRTTGKVIFSQTLENSPLATSLLGGLAQKTNLNAEIICWYFDIIVFVDAWTLNQTHFLF